MKLVSYFKDNEEQLALVHKDHLYDLNVLSAYLPQTMEAFLNGWDKYYPLALEADKLLDSKEQHAIHVSSVELLAPVPNPTSCRDGYAFRQHVEAARRNRDAESL